jgi:4-amino-4-deoxy-L-arabinose transferase-like glycosyltransferase
MRERVRTLVVPAALVVALGIRLVVIFAVFYTLDGHTGDSAYYMLIARHLHRLGLSPDNPAVAGMSSGPLYPVFLAPFLNWLPDPLTQVMAARVAQAVLDVGTVALLYGIASMLFGERTAYLALVIQALDPRYILQTALIATETLFIALFTAFIWLYLTAVKKGSLHRYFGAGLLLGLATLTRPIPLLYPLVLAGHAWAIRRTHPRAWAGFGLLALGMVALVVPWTARNIYVTGGELVPVTDTAATHLWMSSREEGGDLAGDAFGQAQEEDMGDIPSGGYATNNYVPSALRNILANPLDWLGRVGGEVLSALLQPYGTVVLSEMGGPTYRPVVLDVLRGRAPLSALWHVSGFWRKLVIYIFHYVVLIGGIIGIAVSARQWRQVLPLVGWIVYGVAVTAPLLIEPRYVFPVMPYLMLFAASAIARERPRPEEV